MLSVCRITGTFRFFIPNPISESLLADTMQYHFEGGEPAVQKLSLIHAGSESGIAADTIAAIAPVIPELRIDFSYGACRVLYDDRIIFPHGIFPCIVTVNVDIRILWFCHYDAGDRIINIQFCEGSPYDKAREGNDHGSQQELRAGIGGFCIRAAFLFDVFVIKAFFCK